MATEKVGVYRKWHGPIPIDGSGQPLSKREWSEKRPCAWAARWFGSEGKRYSKSFKTRKEAERFAETKQQDVRHGKSDPPTRLSVKQFYCEHKRLMANTGSPKTLHMQLTTLALLATSVGWDRDLKRIDSRDIEQFRAVRAATGNQAVTVNKEVRSLKRLFNLAVLRGYVSPGCNPCVGVALTKVGRKRIAYCPSGDFECIFGKAGETMWQAMLVVIFTTGLRLREATNLTWSDIDFATGMVHVTRKTTKGFVQAWSPKDHEMREIPLPKPAVDLLTAWQSVAPEKCPYVFMDAERWSYYREKVVEKLWKANADLMNNLLRRFKTLCRQAGVGPYTIHDLRRSCITNWARNIPIHVAQQLAGHGDIRTTQAYYLSVQTDDLTKAKEVQASMVKGLEQFRSTDPKLTQSTSKRDFPKRKLFGGLQNPLKVEEL